MKSFNRLLFVLLFSELTFLYLQATHSFFLDTAVSSSNTFTASAEFPVTSTPTPENIADHLVISEIQINGANANEDFIELYNPTNSSIDLNGWQLRIKNSAGNDESLILIGSDNSILAHGFFLWASTKSNDYEIDIGADIFNTNSLSENNSLLLEDSSDNPIDQVGWGNVVGHYIEGTPYPNSPASSQSLERKALSTSDSTSMSSGADLNKGNGFDTNNNSTDFVLRTTSQPQNSSSPTESP